MLEEWKTLLLELLLVDGFAESEVGSFLIFVFCLESLSIGLCLEVESLDGRPLGARRCYPDDILVLHGGKGG